MTNSWHYDCDNNKRMIIYARSNEGVKAAPQTLYRMASYDYVKLLTQTLLQRTKIKVEEAVFTRIKLPKLVHCVVGCWASIAEAELQHINILDTDTKWKFITTSAKTFAIHYLGPRPMMSKPHTHLHKKGCLVEKIFHPFLDPGLWWVSLTLHTAWRWRVHINLLLSTYVECIMFSRGNLL